MIRAPVGRYFCPVALPWFWSRRSANPVDRLRRGAYEFNERTARRRLPVRTLRYVLSWPVLCVGRACEATRACGRQVVAQGGPGLWRQFATIVGLGIGRNFTPKSYYLFQLWRPERARRAASYIQDFEGRWILNAINRGKDLAFIDDKSRFAEFCARHSLPTVPILAEFGGPHGSAQAPFTTADLPRDDLFVKQAAATAVAGAGAECWLYQDAADSWRRRDRELGRRELLEHLCALGTRARTLLQQRVRNHAALAGFSLRALCSVRAVTIREPGSRAVHFRSCLRMPAGNSDVDHPVHGGLAAPISREGVLGAASANVVGPAYTHHPATGARIEGCALPHFAEAIALAVRAHDLAAVDAAIGWDIAITPAGPLFLEGNSVWGTDVMQTSFDAPLGDSELIRGLQNLLDQNRLPTPT